MKHPLSVVVSSYFMFPCHNSHLFVISRWLFRVLPELSVLGPLRHQMAEMTASHYSLTLTGRFTSGCSGIRGCRGKGDSLIFHVLYLLKTTSTYVLWTWTYWKWQLLCLILMWMLLCCTLNCSVLLSASYLQYMRRPWFRHITAPNQGLDPTFSTLQMS